ncbi:MAG: 4-oxalomesaconate tautomerase [Gammaproteobacteria bacterium]|nr:4-oxalomesaconate tautomerase [Gammaproteobacteria bacterium]
MQHAIPCLLMRGGTSRGAYFLRRDLPQDPDQLSTLLAAVMGGPDAIQVDGIGGGHPLNNKVAVIGPASIPDADVDYLFLQVIPGERRATSAQNCGNILAAVGPFALETGLVMPTGDETTITVNMLNTGKLCRLIVQTPNGRVRYDGDCTLDGVPGSSAPIVCDFLDVAGSSCGALLPTGAVVDRFDDILATCIDNGMPVVLLRAADFGVTGYESPAELDGNKDLKQRLEAIRLEAGPRMRLGDVAKLTVPKMTLLAPARDGGHVHTRTFIPHICHETIGVFGAVSVATACVLPGSVATGITRIPAGASKTLRVEHPSGALDVRIALGPPGADGIPTINGAGLLRSARLLFRGEVYVPERLPE